jgi:putative ABC transport system permease protein
MGVLPALRSGRTELLRSGRGTMGHAGRLRGTLVSAEVALSTTLLIGAGLLIRSLSAFGAVEVGVATENRLTLRIAPSWASVPERVAADALYRTIEERIEAVPGVTSVGAVNRMPLEGNWWSGGLAVRGRAPLPASQQPDVLNRIVTPGYFEAVGIRLLRGRLPDATDVATGQRVMVISETAARLIWNGDDPIGALVTNEDAGDAASAWYTVVGIVSDARYGGLDQPMSAVGYTTLAQGRWGHFGDWGMSLVVATSGEPTAVIPAVRAAVTSVDAGLPAYDVRTMRGRLDDALSSRRHTTRLLTVFAALALLLAAIGTYAVLAFTVSRQIPEIGLRIALGATAASVAALVLRRGVQPALLGIALGLVAAAASAPVIGGMLFGVQPLDATTFASIAALLSVVVIAACLLPAVRASRLSPARALSKE